MVSLFDVIGAGRSVVVFLLMRAILFFASTDIVLSLVGWNYSQALLWANMTVVIVDVIILLVLSRLLTRQNHRLRDLLVPSWLSTAWGLLTSVILQVRLSASTFTGILVTYQGDSPASEVLHGVPVWTG